VTGLSLGRIAVGALSFARPELAAGLFGLDVKANPQGPYLARLFGSREIALGVATLLATGTARRNLVLAGIAVDLGDAATGVLGIQDKSVSTRTAAMLVVPAVGAVISGIGGQLGATVGRRLPTPVLRLVIVLVGVVALTVFLAG
jgi:hypothetical protein